MIIVGDCRDVLRTLEDGSVQMCVTSPPYWGLRDYGTATWDGGDPSCDHVMDSGVQGVTGQRAERSFTARGIYKQICGKCGASRIDAQVGLEPTPGEYVERMVAVFREVRRVLRDDGTLWLNLGSSYASNGGAARGDRSDGIGQANVGDGLRRASALRSARACGSGLNYIFKPKDMVPIPWMVAMALQADGWYLRQDIIWSKPNPMPESVRDRCTKAHEYIFLMAKSERYYFDAEAIAEASSGRTDMGMMNRNGRLNEGGEWETPEPDYKFTRNKRSVWTVPSQPYSEAHFATFPPALIEPCILAGSKPGDVVLDPFAGSGTTGQVAEALGRKWLLIELNGEYAKLCADRTRQIGISLA